MSSKVSKDRKSIIQSYITEITDMLGEDTLIPLLLIEKVAVVIKFLESYIGRPGFNRKYFDKLKEDTQEQFKYSW